MSNPGTSLLHYPPISSSSLSSALLKCRFYVFSINSSFVSSFDLESHVWSNLQTLKPPGVSFSFLISCKDRPVLAGIGSSQGGSSFNLWRIDEKTIEFSEFAFVPQDLLYSLFDSDEDNKFASLKCVGLGDLIYVFNEDYHKRYPACVLRLLLLLLNSLVAASAGGGEYPNCLSPVNKFHQVISLCSTVSLHSILRGRGGDAGAEAYVWGFIISFPLPGNVMQMMDLQDSYAWNRERSCVHKKKIVMLLDQRLYIG